MNRTAIEQRAARIEELAADFRAGAGMPRYHTRELIGMLMAERDAAAAQLDLAGVSRYAAFESRPVLMSLAQRVACLRIVSGFAHT